MRIFGKIPLSRPWLFLMAFSLAAPLLHASILGPGDTAPPDLLTVGPGATLEATFSGTIAPGTFVTNYTTWVYSDPTNTFCPGCLDFVYQFHNVGKSGIPGGGVNERFTMFDFTGYSIDAGYTPGKHLRPPIDVSRSTTGAVIGFDYTGKADLKKGQTTNLLIIETNAGPTQFGDGLVTVQDGSAGTGTGFAPTPITTVPEPGSMALMGGGLLLASAYLRRKMSSPRI